MEKVIISGNLDSYKIVILDDNDNLDDVIFGGESFKSIKSNIYLAQVTKVEPSLQAAFVNYGENKSGFLPFSEIHKMYFNSNAPVSEILKNFCNPEEFTINQKPDDQEVLKGDEVESSQIDKVQFELNEDSHDETVEVKRVEEKDQKRKLSIQDVIKSGQFLLVQVFKDERGNKGVSMTTYITIPTKYFVFTANDSRLSGISRRIADQRERVRLRGVLSSFFTSENSGLVVRTAAKGVEKEELIDDYKKIAMESWSSIIEKSKSSQIGLIQKSESRIISSIRDITNSSTKIITDNEEIAKVICETSGSTINVKKEHTIIHKDKSISLFDKLHITEKLNDLYRDRVNLESGGYLIINYTEALVSIDVNSGSLVREKNIEDTAIKTNIEAVVKIAEQIRLRDIGGLIVVDFIDMDDVENRKKVETKMKEELSARDRARVQFTAISPFGLMEISRQRLRTGFIDVSTAKCTHCYGTGRIFKSEVVLDELLKIVTEATQLKEKIEKIRVETSFEVESMYQYHNKADILAVCDAAKIEIQILASSSIKYDKFTVFVKKSESVEMEEFKKFHGLSNIGESRSVEVIKLDGVKKGKSSSKIVVFFSKIAKLFTRKKVEKKQIYSGKKYAPRRNKFEKKTYQSSNQQKQGKGGNYNNKKR